MPGGRDDWEDDGDALYGDGKSEDLRPPQRPRGRPSERGGDPRPESFEDPRGQYRTPSGQDPVVGQQQPPSGEGRQPRREPSFGPGGEGYRDDLPPEAANPPGAASKPGAAGPEDWDDIDPYEDFGGRGATAQSWPPKKRRSRLAPIILALVFLAAFGAIAWYAYTWGVGGGQSGPIPLITADNDDIKEQPPEGQEGGAEVPYQDSEVLNEGESDGPESILPPPETPEPIPAAPDATAPAQGADAQSEEGTGASTSDLPPPPPPPPGDAAPSTETAPEAPLPEPAPQPAAEPAPEPTPEPAPAPQVAAVPDGAVVIQLAAVRSAEAAQSEWSRIQSENAGLLGDMSLLTQEIDIEGRGIFFRIQTGPFPNRATAQDICAQLKANGQDCLVKTR